MEFEDVIQTEYTIKTKPNIFFIIKEENKTKPDFLVVSDKTKIVTFVNSKESFCIPKKYLEVRENKYFILNQKKIITTGCRNALNENEKKILKIFRKLYKKTFEEIKAEAYHSSSEEEEEDETDENESEVDEYF